MRDSIHQQAEIIEACPGCARDFERLVAVLDPEVVVRIDRAAARPGTPREIRGARNRANGAMALAQFG